MNAKGDANRSVRETKRKLGTALVELLQKKTVQQITVRELTSLAHVSRGTFYFHYTDIYDLMTRMEQEQLSQLNSLMDSLLPRMRQDSAPESLGALFDYLEENHEMCSALYGPHGDPEFWRQIKELIARLKEINPFVEGNIFKSVENVNLDTIIAYKKDGRHHHFLEEYELPKKL